MDKLTAGEFVAIWWALVWRATLLSALFGFVLGFIGGFIAALLGYGDRSADIGAVMGYIGSVPAAGVALWFTLRKKFKAFRLEIVRDPGLAA
ncbi:MAG: hypothetical protein K1X51_11695 [Rhodospirillaceae bacterium]|nr:hypothetical protein [Rhodospirillaceae bacterium]